jgi:hypothetical protein
MVATRRTAPMLMGSAAVGAGTGMASGPVPASISVRACSLMETLYGYTRWVNYVANRANRWTNWLELNIGVESVGLTDLIVCDVLHEYKDDKPFDANLGLKVVHA